MRQICQRLLYLALAVTPFVLTACSASSQTVNTQSSPGTAATGFSNILVIGLANDYEYRTRFERKLVSELQKSGASATALYVAAGGNKPIEREAIEQLVRENGYDAVLISRPLNRDTAAHMKTGSAGAKAVRKDDGALKLFRYNYEELNEPVTWGVDVSVTLLSELLPAKDKQIAWAAETKTSRKDSIDELIDEAAKKIISRLKRDRMVGS